MNNTGIEHVSDLIALCAEVYPKERVLSYPHYKTDVWKHITGLEFSELCMAAAKGLAEFGIQPGQAVGIYSPNRQECLYCELGLFALRGVSVPFYSTSSPDQVEFVSKSADLKLIFVGEQYQYNNAYQVQREKGQIERIVIFDRRVVKQFNDHTSIYYDEFVRMGDSMRNETIVKERRGECMSSDLAVIIYTSGTTGDPKGVMVLQSAMALQVNIHHLYYPTIDKSDISVNFLPMSHIFEKMWVYFCLSRGVRTAIVTDPKRIQELMPQIRPTLMCNVPRYWEKVYQGVKEHMETSSKLAKAIYKSAINVGKRYRLEFRNLYRKPPFFLKLKYYFYALTVFALLKRVIGLDRGRFYPTAGAQLSDEINIFLQSCGFPIIVGYGLSESCATVSSYPTRGYVINSIGRVSDILQVRIAPEDNEIQLKGRTISPGYYRNEQATREAFTEDGWFKTGDAGHMEGDVLFFHERIKDLFKTANGKYVAPQQVEALLSADPYIEQVACIGDGYKFVSALIYPNWKKLIDLAKERNLIEGEEPISALASNKQIGTLLMSRIETLQGSLASFEKVKRIIVLETPLSMERGELTNTLKIKRRVVYDHYAEEIREIYAE